MMNAISQTICIAEPFCSQTCKATSFSLKTPAYAACKGSTEENEESYKKKNKKGTLCESITSTT